MLLPYTSVRGGVGGGGGHGGGTVGSGGSDTFKRSISSLLSFLIEAFTD